MRDRDDRRALMIISPPAVSSAREAYSAGNVLARNTCSCSYTCDHLDALAFVIMEAVTGRK